MYILKQLFFSILANSQLKYKIYLLKDKREYYYQSLEYEMDTNKDQCIHVLCCSE